MPKNLGRDLRWREGGAPPNLSKWVCHLQTMYINSDNDICWGASFELSIVSLSIQNLNYLYSFIIAEMEKLGVGASVKRKLIVFLWLVCVLFFVLVRNLSCITSIASLDLLPTKSLPLGILSGWLSGVLSAITRVATHS